MTTDYKNLSERLAYIIYQMMEGDIPEGILETLEKYGYVDSDHEWIYEDE